MIRTFFMAICLCFYAVSAQATRNSESDLKQSWLEEDSRISPPLSLKKDSSSSYQTLGREIVTTLKQNDPDNKNYSKGFAGFINDDEMIEEIQKRINEEVEKAKTESGVVIDPKDLQVTYPGRQYLRYFTSITGGLSIVGSFMPFILTQYGMDAEQLDGVPASIMHGLGTGSAALSFLSLHLTRYFDLQKLKSIEETVRSKRLLLMPPSA